MLEEREIYRTLNSTIVKAEPFYCQKNATPAIFKGRFVPRANGKYIDKRDLFRAIYQ